MTRSEAIAIGEKMRELLLSIPFDARDEEYQNLRTTALSAMDVCSHCGTDDRGRVWGCQCWNDE